MPLAHQLTNVQFKRAAGGAVRRGLFSLLMAGGLVFSIPEDTSVATALPAVLSRPPEIAGLLKEPPLGPLPEQNTIFHKKTGLTFDIRFFSPWEKAKGFDHVQRRIDGELKRLSLKMGLNQDEYVRLVKQLYPPGRAVSLPDILDENSAIGLLKNHFPNLVADLVDQKVSQAHTMALYRLVARIDAGECAFWDRLYSEYRGLKADRAQALGMVLANINLHLHAPKDGTAPRIRRQTQTDPRTGAHEPARVQTGNDPLFQSPHQGLHLFAGLRLRPQT